MKIDELDLADIAPTTILKMSITIDSFFDIPKFALQRDAKRHSRKLVNSLRKANGDVTKLNYNKIDSALMVTAVKFSKDCQRVFENGRPTEHFKADEIYLIDGNSRKYLWQRNEIKVPLNVDLLVHTVHSFHQASNLYYSYNNSASVELKQDKISGVLADVGVTLKSKFFASGYNYAITNLYSDNIQRGVAAQKDSLMAVDAVFENLRQFGKSYNTPLRTASILLGVIELKKHNGALSPEFIRMMGLISTSNPGITPDDVTRRSPLLVLKEFANEFTLNKDYRKQTGQMLYCMLKYLQDEDVGRRTRNEESFRELHLNVKTMVKDLFENDGEFTPIGKNAIFKARFDYLEL